MFGHTGGWTFEEAVAAGAHTGPDQALWLTGMPAFIFDAVDATVLSPEETALSVFFGGEPLVARLKGKLLLRCIGTPPKAGLTDQALIPTSPYWEALKPFMPRIHGLCTVSKPFADNLDAWARENGFCGPQVKVIPHGVLGDLPESSDRKGVVYLGSLIGHKQVEVVILACAKAKMKLTICAALDESTQSRELPQLQALARANGVEVEWTSVGDRRRTELLQRSLVVVTASRGESQWLPGFEGKACGAVAIAPDEPLIRDAHGDGLLYYDGTVEGLASCLHSMDKVTQVWAKEWWRQRRHFLGCGRSMSDVGSSLWSWVLSVAAGESP